MVELLPPLWAGLILGLAGSLHCAGMCGPLVLAAARISKTNDSPWRSTALHHAGRITTYGLLGLTVGSLGQTFSLVGWQQPLTIALGFLVLGATLLVRAKLFAYRTSQWVNGLSRFLSSKLRSSSGVAHFTLGLCHGILPCGLVYIALAAATTTAHPLLGLILMLSFGLGTLPTLLGLTALQQPLSRLRPKHRQWFQTGLALIAGSMLILRGLGLGIPILSPEFSADGKSACCSPSIVVEKPKNDQNPR